MKEYSFELPNKVKVGEKDVDMPFQGEVTIEILPNLERTKLSNEVQFMVKDGEIVDRPEQDMGPELLKLAIKHTKKIDLVLKEDPSLKFSDLKELEYSEEGDVLLGFLGLRILKGIKLGKL